jgi:hypothetical protein
MCSHVLLFLLSKSKLFLSIHLFDIIMNIISNNIRVWCASGGFYLSMKQGGLFWFVCWDLPSHDASCDTHYIFETLFDVEIPQATTLHVVLIVSSRHFWWWLGVHQTCFETASCGAHCIFETLLMTTRSASNLVWDYLELLCKSYWLLNHFLNEN